MFVCQEVFVINWVVYQFENSEPVLQSPLLESCAVKLKEVTNELNRDWQSEGRGFESPRLHLAAKSET